MDFIGSFLLYFNIVGGFLCGIVNLLYIYQNPKRYWLWIKWGYALWAFYYSGVYIYIAVVPDDVILSRMFIRPANSVIIALLLAGSFVRLNPIYIPDLIRGVAYEIKERWVKIWNG